MSDIPEILNSASVALIEQEALRQIADEEHRRKVNEAKKRLLTKRLWWHKLFPFTVTITRRK